MMLSVPVPVNVIQFHFNLHLQVLTVKTESLVSANPDILDGVDDLMQLSYLNEPSVLYNLQYRYDHNMIYVCSLVCSFNSF